MAYLIKTYTFDQPISTGGTAYPFNGQTGISFADADEHVIYLDNSDSKFQQVTIYNGQSQKLLIETELGGTVLPEGTVMTYNIAKVGTLIDPVTNAAYYVFFPSRRHQHQWHDRNRRPKHGHDRSDEQLDPAVRSDAHL